MWPEAGQYPQACGGVWRHVVVCGGMWCAHQWVWPGGLGLSPGLGLPLALGTFRGTGLRCRPLCPLLRPSAPWWALGPAGRAGPILRGGARHRVSWSATSAPWAAGMNTHLSSPEPRPLLCPCCAPLLSLPTPAVPSWLIRRGNCFSERKGRLALTGAC